MQSLLEALKRFCMILTVDASHYKFVQSLEKHNAKTLIFTLCDKDVPILQQFTVLVEDTDKKDYA